MIQPNETKTYSKKSFSYGHFIGHASVREFLRADAQSFRTKIRLSK